MEGHGLHLAIIFLLGLSYYLASSERKWAGVKFIAVLLLAGIGYGMICRMEASSQPTEHSTHMASCCIPVLPQIIAAIAHPHLATGEWVVDDLEHSPDYVSLPRAAGRSPPPDRGII